MNSEMSEKKSITLEGTVVCRKVPMTSRGCDMLRAIRDHISGAMAERHGHEYDLSFPVVIHMMMAEYCKMKGIKVDGSTSRE